MNNNATPTGELRTMRTQLAEPMIRCRIVIITPELAREWLARNIANRPLARRCVAAFAQDMINHRWMLNGEPIIFSDKGELLDGQHRLEAIILANVPVRMLVVEGVAERAKLTIDSGISKTTADRFRMFGQVERPQVVAAATTVIACATTTIHRQLTSQESWDLYYEHLEGFVRAEEHVHCRLLPTAVRRALDSLPIAPSRRRPRPRQDAGDRRPSGGEPSHHDRGAGRSLLENAARDPGAHRW